MSKCTHKYESYYPKDINLGGSNGIIKAHHKWFACTRNSHTDIFCDFSELSKEQYDAITTPDAVVSDTPNRPAPLPTHNIDEGFFNLD
jgi:hypothetical protein